MIDTFDLHYQTRDGQVEIILKNVRLYCPRCEKWKAGSLFGLREMAGPHQMLAGLIVPGRHVIRSQPQCKACRNDGTKLPSRATKAQKAAQPKTATKSA